MEKDANDELEQSARDGNGSKVLSTVPSQRRLQMKYLLTVAAAVMWAGSAYAQVSQQNVATTQSVTIPSWVTSSAIGGYATGFPNALKVFTTSGDSAGLAAFAHTNQNVGSGFAGAFPHRLPPAPTSAFPATDLRGPVRAKKGDDGCACCDVVRH